jgi:hypothetical protein
MEKTFFQLKEFEPAASAAFTYHVHNPDSVIMRDNVRWYANTLNNSDFVNREPYVGIGQDSRQKIYCPTFVLQP